MVDLIDSNFKVILCKSKTYALEKATRRSVVCSTRHFQGEIIDMPSLGKENQGKAALHSINVERRIIDMPHLVKNMLLSNLYNERDGQTKIK